MSATQSEAESMLRHREKKVFLNNQGFTAQQREAPRSVDVHIGAIHMGLKNVVEFFAADLEVRYFINGNRESHKPSVAFPVSPCSCSLAPASRTAL